MHWNDWLMQYLRNISLQESFKEMRDDNKKNG